jgi:hypothetical protein
MINNKTAVVVENPVVENPVVETNNIVLQKIYQSYKEKPVAPRHEIDEIIKLYQNDNIYATKKNKTSFYAQNEYLLNN